MCDRRLGEESDGDSFGDSSSDRSSDYGQDRGGLNYSSRQYCYHCQSSDNPFRIDRLSVRDQNMAFLEGFSSDEGESGSSQGCLLFEYLERDQPYSREPLADKVCSSPDSECIICIFFFSFNFFWGREFG